MYVTLLETYAAASDLKTRRTLRDVKVLETCEATDKAIARMHKECAKAIAEGRDVQLVRTALAWADPRRTTTRRQRRAFQKVLRALMKRVPRPSREDLDQVDTEVATVFDAKEKRTRSGLVVPDGSR